MIRAAILGYLREHAVGRENAVKRERLMEIAAPFFPEGTRPETIDREMRRAYKSIPHCWGKEGIWLPKIPEVDHQLETLEGYIKAYASKQTDLLRYRDWLRGERQLRLV